MRADDKLLFPVFFDVLRQTSLGAPQLLQLCVPSRRRRCDPPRNRRQWPFRSNLTFVIQRAYGPFELVQSPTDLFEIQHLMARCIRGRERTIDRTLCWFDERVIDGVVDQPLMYFVDELCRPIAECVPSRTSRGDALPQKFALIAGRGVLVPMSGRGVAVEDFVEGNRQHVLRWQCVGSRTPISFVQVVQVYLTDGSQDSLNKIILFEPLIEQLEFLRPRLQRCIGEVDFLIAAFMGTFRCWPVGFWNNSFALFMRNPPSRRGHFFC